MSTLALKTSLSKHRSRRYYVIAKVGIFLFDTLLHLMFLLSFCIDHRLDPWKIHLLDALGSITHGIYNARETRLSIAAHAMNNGVVRLAISFQQRVECLR